MVDAVAAAVSRDRLWQRLMALAEIGAIADGGVNRPALSALDARARRQVADWGRGLGCSVASDPAGNLFLRRPGRDPGLSPILVGSHLDTQPQGGKFDGAYGVLAALEIVAALNDAGITTTRPVEVVAWTNEEGARFQPGCAGSAAFAGSIPLERLRAGVDRDGVAFGADLDLILAQDRADGFAERPLGFPVAAYFEGHIEQGPRLEMAGVPVGIVTGLPAMAWFRVEVRGETAHAGTTPRAARKDALSAACAMVKALEHLAADPEDAVRFTVGRFEVHPGAPNTVPDRVLFTIDLRHPDTATVERLGAAIPGVCRDHAGPCAVAVEATMRAAACPFDPALISSLRDLAGRLGLTTLSLPSGAYHDARYLADVAPAAMVFIPCRNGVSHHPAEYASPEAAAAGARLLAAAVVAVAGVVA